TGTGTGTGSGSGIGGGAVTGPMALQDGAVGRRADGGRTEALSGGKPSRKQRAARVVVWSAVVVLFTGGGAGTAWYLMHSGESTAPQSTSDKGAPSVPSEPDNSIGPPPPLPDGYRTATESALGVTFPVPDGWTRKVGDSGREITYYSQKDLARLTVSVLDLSSGDPVKHFKSLENRQKVDYPPYTQLRLQSTVYQGEPAAIWEYTFGGKTRSYRAADLGFGRAGGTDYAIFVSAPEANWTTFGKVFSAVTNGFRRTDPKS
ncbi:serine/threonine protein kinase, partial [Streptomyces sp. NPDC054765]